MNRKLGRGLDALIRRSEQTSPPDAPASTTQTESEAPTHGLEIRFVAPDEIHANPDQPRSVFEPQAIEELSRSVAADGVLQPLVVRVRPEGGYELGAGERRLRASRMAQLAEIPVIVRDIDNDRMLSLALTENLQREDLNPIELARAYQALQESFDWTQEQLAENVQKKRSSVANTLRFLELEREIQQSLMERKISSGHAKLLLGVQNLRERKEWHQKLLSKKWTVRELDGAIRGDQTQPLTPSQPTKGPKGVKNGGGTHILSEEKRLGEFFGTNVSVIQADKKGRGKITIEFYSTEDYERITDLIVRKS
jgi:ParB family chromosome partitioning protein